MIFRRTLVAAAAALALTLCAASQARAEDDVATPIAALNQGLMTAQKTGTSPFPSRYQALAPVIDKSFDLPKILQTIVGLKWPAIPADQQAKLLAVFRAYTICSYVANFDTDSGDDIRILPERRQVGADTVVETEIAPKQGDPTRIDYVMRKGDAGWKAVDVLQQGTISQAAVQRSDFRGLVADGADKLALSLQEKVDAMSGGTIKP